MKPAAQFVYGPRDGEWWPCGRADLTGTVVPANPERDTLDGPNVLYQWNGRSRWVFVRYVKRGEDAARLCFRQGATA